jgi:hypothetical protein
LAVFAREFWFQLLQFVGLAALTPQPSDSFADWWEKVEGLVCDELRAGLNSLSHLGSWTIWKLRNDCVFNGASPRVATALALAKDEAQLWGSAGTKGLSLLTIRGFGWSRVACWFGLVRFVSFRRVLGLMEMMVRWSGPGPVGYLFILWSKVCGWVGVSWSEFSVFSLCQVYVRLFFFYQYNDTQLSCVVEKKE